MNAGGRGWPGAERRGGHTPPPNPLPARGEGEGKDAGLRGGLVGGCRGDNGRRKPRMEADGFGSKLPKHRE